MDTKKEKTDNVNEFPPAGAEPLWAVPVVSVLGHVDHGKTSLLDKIRETTIATREKGGITQKIGASQVEIDSYGGPQDKHEGKKRKITFIDTPGHEAFANMRSQGVNAADIALLIVAADDGVMPQTRESIVKILEAKIPFIVVFTKIDIEGVSIERAKQTLVKEGILLEGLGGDVPYIGVSSKTGDKVKDLLDLIVLVYDMSAKKPLQASLMGVVIDAKADRRRGVVATVVIKSGKVVVGNKIYTYGKEVGKVKAILDTTGKNVKEAGVGQACEIMGLNDVLAAGSVLFDRETEPAIIVPIAPAVMEPADIMAFLNDEKKDFIPLILKSETTAEMEAIINAMPENVKIIFAGQGEIGIADVLMAKDFRALIFGFNVDIKSEAKTLADSEKVFYKSYEIIYQMLDEIHQLLSAIATGEQERILGKGQILASFAGTTGTIIGVKVSEGRLAVGDRIRIMRSEKEMGSAEITSIRRGKEGVKTAAKNMECGIMISHDIDFMPQDAIIAYSKKQ